MTKVTCMSPGWIVRRAATALGLAFMLLLGQHMAALHDLGHAFENLHETEPGAPDEPGNCPHHATFSDLTSAAPADAAAAFLVNPVLVLALPQPVVIFAATRFAFHSRAPPALRD